MSTSSSNLNLNIQIMSPYTNRKFVALHRQIAELGSQPWHCMQRNTSLQQIKCVKTKKHISHLLSQSMRADHKMPHDTKPASRRSPPGLTHYFMRKRCGLWSALHRSNGWKFLLYSNNQRKWHVEYALRKLFKVFLFFKKIPIKFWKIRVWKVLKTHGIYTFRAIASLRCLCAWLTNNDIFKLFDAINYLVLLGYVKCYQTSVMRLHGRLLSHMACVQQTVGADE